MVSTDQSSHLAVFSSIILIKILKTKLIVWVLPSLMATFLSVRDTSWKRERVERKREPRMFQSKTWKAEDESQFGSDCRHRRRMPARYEVFFFFWCIMAVQRSQKFRSASQTPRLGLDQVKKRWLDGSIRNSSCAIVEAVVDVGFVRRREVRSAQQRQLPASSRQTLGVAREGKLNGNFFFYVYFGILNRSLKKARVF